MNSTLNISNNKVTLQLQPYKYIKITINGDEPVLNISNGLIHTRKIAHLEIYSDVNQIDQSFPSLKLKSLNQETTKLFETIDVNIPVEFYFAENKVTTSLPKEMSANLVRFLKRFRPEYNKKDYCCIDFAYEMAYGRDKYEKYHTGRLKDYFDQADPNIFNENNLISGDIVYMYKSKDLFPYHWAIFIGQRCYLSLNGVAPGPLGIATLEEMKKSNLSDICIKVSKINNNNSNNLDNKKHIVASVSNDGIFSNSQKDISEKTLTMEDLIEKYKYQKPSWHPSPTVRRLEKEKRMRETGSVGSDRIFANSQNINQQNVSLMDASSLNNKNR